jgi:hypothetical protein
MQVISMMKRTHVSNSKPHSEFNPGTIEIENTATQESTYINSNDNKNLIGSGSLKLKLKLNYDGQSASLSWCQAPLWDQRPIFLSPRNFLETVADFVIL